MKKLLTAGVVALGLIFSTQSVSAQSIAELQAMIAALQAQLAALAGQGTTTTTSAYTHTVTLKVGSKGAQVTALQSALNSLGFNAGAADGIFGNGTKAAVVAFQASKGLTADGIVGPATGAALSAATVTNPGNGGSTSGTMSDEEADVSVKIASSEDELNRNTSNQLAFTFEVKADKNGGDAKVERADLEFTVNPVAGGETRAYKIMKSVTLKVDGKKVADADTDAKSDWRNYSSPYDNGSVRLSGMDVLVKSGQTAEFGVFLDIADLKDADVENGGNNLNIELTSVDVRFVDGSGIIAVESDTTAKDIDVVLDAATELDITKNKNYPKDDFSVNTKDSAKTATLAIFDIDVKGTDGVLEDAVVTFGGSFDGTSVKNVTLYNGSKAIDTVEYADFDSGFTKAAFDLDDLEIEDGDTLKFEVKVNLRKGSVAGDSISVTDIAITGEDEGENVISESYSVPTPTSAIFTNGDVEAETTYFDNTLPINTLNPGLIQFTLEITNKSGVDLDMTSEVFKIEGVSGGAGLASDAGNAATLVKGATDTFVYTIGYTNVSQSKDLKIVLETIDDMSSNKVPVFYTVDVDA